MATTTIQRAGQSTQAELVQPPAFIALTAPIRPADTTIEMVYDQVHRLYATVRNFQDTAAREEFDKLPAEMRRRILGHISTLDKSSQTDNPQQSSETHMVVPLLRLREAIEKVAFTAFDALEQNQKHLVASRVCMYFGDYRVGDRIWRGEPHLRRIWGEEHAKDDARILLQSLSDMDQTPEFMATLDTWVEEASIAPGSQVENRQEARRRMIAFLDNRCAVTLDLSELSLPDVPKDFFTIVQCSIRIQGLTLESNCLTDLPPEIDQLHALRYLSLKKNPLTFVPTSIFQLSQDCTVDLRDTHLSKAVIEQLKRLLQSPTYKGPKRIYFEDLIL